MKKLLRILFVIGLFLFAGNLFAQEAVLKAKTFARAWEKLKMKKISSMLENDAKGELSGFTFAEKLDEETFKNKNSLISLLNSLSETEKKKFLSCFSVFSSSMKIQKKTVTGVVAVSNAKGNAKSIVCFIRTNSEYKIIELKVLVCCDRDELNTALELVGHDFEKVKNWDDTEYGEDVDESILK